MQADRIGRRIREIRGFNLTQAEFGRTLGVGQTQLSKYERSERADSGGASQTKSSLGQEHRLDTTGEDLLASRTTPTPKSVLVCIKGRQSRKPTPMDASSVVDGRSSLSSCRRWEWNCGKQEQVRSCDCVSAVAFGSCTTTAKYTCGRHTADVSAGYFSTETDAQGRPRAINATAYLARTEDSNS